MTIQDNVITYHTFTPARSCAHTPETDGAESATVQNLEKELAACKNAESEWKNRFMMLSADFENYKRRISKEQALWMQDAQAVLLQNVLTIADDIDRALDQQTINLSPEMQTWLQGFLMIQKSFQEFLKKSGVQEVSYDVFDPHIHEALMEVDSSEHTSGQIVNILQKGYRLGEKVIRPARVSVAR